MKSVITLICIAAISGPCASVAFARTSNGPAANNSAAGAVHESQALAATRRRTKQPALQPQSNLSSLKHTVVSEMRATKAFVKESVVEPGGTNRGLLLLAASGLIVLQLRRKHKSLPQRPIAPYA